MGRQEDDIDVLKGKPVTLGLLSREDCRTLWENDEYDFDHPTDLPHRGLILISF